MPTSGTSGRDPGAPRQRRIVVTGPTESATVLGFDIGGTGIKASQVNLRTGALLVQRDRRPTPRSATPDKVIGIVRALLSELHDEIGNRPDRIGVGFPGVVRHGVIRTAANLHSSWVGVDLASQLSDALEVPSVVVNDADAAGLAEVRFGAGSGQMGLVIMITLGTGIGSGLFLDGKLVPNSELGHLLVRRGGDAESWAAASVRERKDLSWKKWGRRVGGYLQLIEQLFSPEIIIVGGGVSEHFDRFAPYIDDGCPVVAASLGNDAGIVGAALSASAPPR